MLSREDRILSELIVSRGLATPETVERLARKLESSNERGLVQAMVSRGEIDPTIARKIQDEAREINDLLEADLPEGKTLGEFTLIREIGRGGMGIVYEAEQASLGRRVALKVLPAGATLDERLAIRFLREARTVARLRHPGIVPVFGTGHEQGVLFFAMELVDGETLADRIARGPIAARGAAAIASEVAHALQHAHDAGLIHRDVKPENVILGKDGRARLTDFGLVHDVHGARLTRSQYVLGTPAYSAPEQARGEPVDPSSDIYGLGAVLYAMLAGRPPFGGEVPAAVLGRLVSGPPRPLAAVGSNLPREVVAICERAMDRVPSRRYPGAGSMAVALDGFLADEGPLADSRSPRSMRAVAIFVGILAIVALVLLGRTMSKRAVRSTERGTAPRIGLLRGELREIPTPPGNKMTLSMSPDGERIAFLSGSAPSDLSLHMQRVDGSSAVELLPAGALNSYPAFAPDGQRLIYCNENRLELLDLQTGLRTTPYDGCGMVSWAPDGKRVVISERQWPQTRLRSIDLETGESRLITGPGTSRPSWSRHGRIAFVAIRGGQHDVWTCREDGGDVRRVTSDLARELDPVWSSVPGRLYYASNLDTPYDLWEVDLDVETGRVRSGPRHLTHGLIGTWVSISAAAERERLAFVQQADDRRCWALPLDASANPLDVPKRLDTELPCDTDLPRRAAERNDWIVSSGDDRSESLFRYTPSTGTTQVTEGPHRDRTPRWSPDGSTIAFSSDRSGRFEIWTIRPDGSLPVRVTQSPADATSPVWSPDGLRLAYRVEGHGVWVADRDGDAPVRLDDRVAPAGFHPWSWSSEGLLAGTAAGVVVVDPEGGDPVRVSSFGHRPFWFGDGLVFADGHEVFHWESEGRIRSIWSGGPNRIALSTFDAGRGELVYQTIASREHVWLLDLAEE